MKPDRWHIYQRLKAEGLDPGRELKILLELDDVREHTLPPARMAESPAGTLPPVVGLYDYSDWAAMEQMPESVSNYVFGVNSLEELLARDRQREKDGFPRKISVGRMIKPGRGGREKFVIVPSTVEEKFIHDPSIRPKGEGDSLGGSGTGAEGEVIGEQPVRPGGEEGEGQAGQGGDTAHEIESSAYDLGRILTEKFELPNLQEKGKKSSLTRYIYDLTDKNRGFGQVLDKKATLRRILETNISLGNVPDVSDIDTNRLLIAPRDKVYRILSRELDYQPQALVFFIRDYSGSMTGKATELVVSQHVLIYSWLIYQFSRQVESRFILHDTEAREVPDFHTYYNSRVAGGTVVASAYRLVNEIVERESLARDYNIYVFQGTDGDDWENEGKDAVPELEKMLGYASRVGVTIAEHVYGYTGTTEVQKYLKYSGLLESKPNLLRLDVMGEDADETRVIEGIRTLIS